MDRVYKIASNDFITGGGGAIIYPALGNGGWIDSGYKMDDVVVEYLKSHKQGYIGKIEGRIMEVTV